MSSLSELVVRYRYVRALGQSMSKVVLKAVTKDVMDEGGRDLGILRDGVLVFGTEDEAAILFDYCIHCIRHDGRNVVDKLIADNAFLAGLEEADQLRAMNESWYSLFTVDRVEQNVGIRIRDMFRKTTHLLIDFGLSQSAQVGGVMAAAQRRRGRGRQTVFDGRAA
jgi:hypothetical protein